VDWKYVAGTISKGTGARGACQEIIKEIFADRGHGGSSATGPNPAKIGADRAL